MGASSGFSPTPGAGEGRPAWWRARGRRAWWRARGRPPRTLGFTLVEVLIAITVAGILGAGILALVLGQNRFYGHHDDAIYASQSLRAAMDLMAAELRIASPTDLIEAESDRVSVRFDLSRAVVCGPTDPLGLGDEVALFVYDSVTNANLPADFRGTAVSGPYDASFAYADGWTGTASVGGLAQTLCEANGTPPDPGNVYQLVSGWSDEFGSAPDPGSIVRRYGQLTYSFAASGFGSGLAVWRNAQELVSPFDEGARFRYEMADGSIQDNVSDPDLPGVRMIRIEVTAVGDGANRYGVERPLDYTVPLRN